MMAITKALLEVRMNIPPQILQEVFAPKTTWHRPSSNTINENIMATVIRPRVAVDCDLVGGVEILVDLTGIPMEVTNDYTSVYRIPKGKTQGRSIISVSSITYGDLTRMSVLNAAPSQGQSAMLQAGDSLVNAMGSFPTLGSAQVQLIGENVVMVRDQITLPPRSFLRCTIGNDEALSHLQVRSLIAFSKLVVLAVKAYIYNELIITLDQAKLQGGQELGAFKTLVESYADANELYQTFLAEHWTKVAFMNDRESYSRFLKMVIGGPR